MRCVALANLCCVRLWIELHIRPDHSAQADTDHPATILACLLLSGFFVTIFEFAPSRVRVAVCVGTAVLIAKESCLAVEHLGWKQNSWPGLLLVLLTLTLFTIAVKSAFVKTIARLAVNAAVLLALLTIGSSAWIAISSNTLVASASYSPVQSKSVHAARRVVWIVFDELDDRSAFSKRPAELRLPALDRFHTHAEYRAIVDSSASIPSLLAGRPQTDPGGNGTITRKLTAKGFRTAVVGWSLPYCQHTAATECASWPEARQDNSYGPLPILNRFRSFLESARYSPFGYSPAVRHHVSQMDEIARAATAAARPDLEFVFLHLPHARPPFVWEPGTGEPNGLLRPWRIAVICAISNGQTLCSPKSARVWKHPACGIGRSFWSRPSSNKRGRSRFC